MQQGQSILGSWGFSSREPGRVEIEKAQPLDVGLTTHSCSSLVKAPTVRLVHLLVIEQTLSVSNPVMQKVVEMCPWGPPQNFGFDKIIIISYKSF